jgi:hypothetical protein
MGGTTMGKLVLTDRPDEFANELRPGDLVLFDSMSLVAGLTKWADRAPFNHVALVVDGKKIIEANRKPSSTAHASDAATSEVDRAVRSVELSQRLHQPGISTISALRHPHAASGGTDVERVTARATSYLERADRFSQVDLALIGQERFLLNYAEELGEAKHKRLWKLFMHLSQLLVSSVGDGRRSISCSEFVYRCYVESGVPEFKLERTHIPHLDHDEHRHISATHLEEFRQLRQRLHAHNADAMNESFDDEWAPHTLPLADRISPGDFARSDDFVRIAVLNHDRKIISPPKEGDGAN